MPLLGLQLEKITTPIYGVEVLTLTTKKNYLTSTSNIVRIV